MKQKNKVANFWIRLVTRLIDFIVCFSLSTTFLPLIFVQEENNWILRSNFLFYVWVLLTIFLFCFFLIFIPLFTKGKTIGSFITRTKVVVLEGSLIKGLCKREIVSTWGLVFIILSFGTFLNHTMIIKLVNQDQLNNLSAFESFRLSLATTFASFFILGQMIVAISPLVRKDKIALNDLYANTRFVYISKFIEKKVEKKKIIIIPKFVKDEPIEWIK